MSKQGRVDTASDGIKVNKRRGTVWMRKKINEQTGRYFYVDHKSKTTTWLNPLDEKTKPKSVSECCRDDQLPYGWERIDDLTLGVYYTDHIKKRNQWTNPVTDWHRRRSIPLHDYSNSDHILRMVQSGHSLDGNGHTISPLATSKPDTSFRASDIEKSATSLNNSSTLDTEIISSTRSNTSTRNSRYDDAGLLVIMDNRWAEIRARMVNTIITNSIAPKESSTLMIVQLNSHSNDLTQIDNLSVSSSYLSRVTVIMSLFKSW